MAGETEEVNVYRDLLLHTDPPLKFFFPLELTPDERDYLESVVMRSDFNGPGPIEFYRGGKKICEVTEKDLLDISFNVYEYLMSFYREKNAAELLGELRDGLEGGRF